MSSEYQIPSRPELAQKNGRAESGSGRVQMSVADLDRFDELLMIAETASIRRPLLPRAGSLGPWRQLLLDGTLTACQLLDTS